MWKQNGNNSDLKRFEFNNPRVLRSIVPRKSSYIGYVSYADRGALNLFELVKKSDLEGIVVKRKDGKYSQQTLWYKILNPTYIPKSGRLEFFSKAVK
jgi:hypothetical protein